MHDLFKLYKVGLIGDSHVVRMKPYIPGYIKVIARGGEQAKNLRNYQEEIKDLDILVVLIGGNDITTRQGTEGRSIKELTDDIKSLVDYADSIGVKALTCDLIPRANNSRGTSFSDQRLLKRMKKRHIRLKFDFVIGKDKVHLTNYEEFWLYLYRKIVIRSIVAIVYDGCK